MPMNFPFLFYPFFSFKLEKGKKVRDLKPTGAQDGRSCQDPRHRCALNAPAGAVTWPLSRVAHPHHPQAPPLGLWQDHLRPGLSLRSGGLDAWAELQSRICGVSDFDPSRLLLVTSHLGPYLQL